MDDDGYVWCPLTSPSRRAGVGVPLGGRPAYSGGGGGCLDRSANRLEWEAQGDKSGVTQPKGHGWVEGSLKRKNETT